MAPAIKSWSLFPLPLNLGWAVTCFSQQKVVEWYCTGFDSSFVGCDALSETCLAVIPTKLACWAMRDGVELKLTVPLRPAWTSQRPAAQQLTDDPCVGPA